MLFNRIGALVNKFLFHTLMSESGTEDAILIAG